MDGMDFCDVMEIVDHWNLEPPVEVLVALYLGYKPRARVKPENEKEKMDPKAFGMVAKAFGDGRTKKTKSLPKRLQQAKDMLKKVPREKK